MNKFTDNKGRNLAFSIDLLAKKRLESLVNIVDPAELKRLYDPDNVELLVDVMFSSLTQQAEPITPEDFAASLHGRFPIAVETWTGELRNFFREYNRRPMVAVLDKMLELMNAGDEKAVEMVKSEETTAAAAELFAKAKATYNEKLKSLVGGNGFTDSPPSAESPISKA